MIRREQFRLDPAAGGGGALPCRQVDRDRDGDRDQDVDEQRDEVVPAVHSERVEGRNEEPVQQRVGANRARPAHHTPPTPAAITTGTRYSSATLVSVSAPLRAGTKAAVNAASPTTPMARPSQARLAHRRFAVGNVVTRPVIRRHRGG